MNNEDEEMQLKKEKKKGKSRLPCTVFSPLMMVLLLLIVLKVVLVAAMKKVGGNTPFSFCIAFVKFFFFVSVLSAYITLYSGKIEVSCC